MQQIHLFFVIGTLNCQRALYCVGVVPQALYSSFSPCSLYLTYSSVCLVCSHVYSLMLYQCSPPPETPRPTNPAEICSNAFVVMHCSPNRSKQRNGTRDFESVHELIQNCLCPPYPVPPSLLLIFKSICY